MPTLPYGCFAGAAGVAGAAGCGVSGVAGAAPPAGAAGALAGAASLSSTDLGAAERDDIICRTNASPKKMPPHHQLALVKRFPACRVPITESEEELAPPKLAASPPPFPD